MSRQCPGTTIERNFEVGTSLSVSLVVNGSTALTPLWDDSSLAPPLNSGATTRTASTSSCHESSTSAATDDGTAAAADTAARNRRLQAASDGVSRSPASFSLSSSPTERRSRKQGLRLLQEQDEGSNTTLDDETTGGSGWAWEATGPIFRLGERSRIRLSSHVLIVNDDQHEGAWAPLLNTSSAVAVAVKEVSKNAEEEEEEERTSRRAGVVTASLESFDVGQEAVFSTLLFFSDVEPVEESSGWGSERQSELLDF